MRPEHLYLADILEACDRILRFIEPIMVDEFLIDEEKQSSVMFNLILIGEAAGHISDEIRQKYPEVKWPIVIAFRNKAVHEYFAMTYQIVWDTAIIDIPLLRTQIKNILDTDFSENATE